MALPALGALLGRTLASSSSKGAALDQFSALNKKTEADPFAKLRRNSAMGGGAGGGGGGSAGDAADKDGALDKFKETLGKVGGAARLAANPIKLAKTAFDSIESSIGQFTSTFVALGDSIGKYVQAANPASYRRFQRAVEDATAVVGRMLTPIMDAMTRTAKRFGGALTSAERAFKPVMDAVTGGIDKLSAKFEKIQLAIQPLIDKFGGELGTYITATVGQFEAMADALKPLIDLGTEIEDSLGISISPLKLATSLIGGMTEGFKKLAKMFERLRTLTEEWAAKFGVILKLKPQEANKSAEGSSFRQASYSSVEEFSKKLSMEAFGQGSGLPPGDVKLLEQGEGLANLVRDIIKKLNSIEEQVGSFISKVAKVQNIGTMPINIAAEIRSAIMGQL